MTTPQREDPYQVITDYQAWADVVREERLARDARNRADSAPADRGTHEPDTDPANGDVRVRAQFDGTTIVAHRSGIGYVTTYTFTAVDPNGHAHTVGTREIGVIAAGDDLQHPKPEKAEVYHAIGSRTRAHLVGLVDVVAGHRVNGIRLSHLQRPLTVAHLHQERGL